MTIKDVRPYERQLLFTPHQKYSAIAATTISVPKNAAYVIVPSRSTNKLTKVLVGATIGSVCLIKEEVYISTEEEEPSQTDDDDNRSSWTYFRRSPGHLTSPTKLKICYGTIEMYSRYHTTI